MEEKYVALAIPFFVTMMFVERWVTRREAEPRYRYADAVTDLSCGLGQQLLEPFFRTASLAAYVFLYAHARVFTVSTSSIPGWIALVLGVDLFYYVFHRASHRINFFWAAHVVHHQSEDYNLAVALRQSWLELLIAWVFYLPLAVVGLSPLAFVAVSTSNTLYQFWIHTRAVKKMPRWFELVLNTPSHHRVHHGVNPKYIDKNYAGMFIVWDRLFGTFQEEDEEVVYGIVHPLASWNPLWANVHYWLEMGAMARATSRFADKLRVVRAPPEWRPRDLSNGLGYVTIPEVDARTRVKFETRSSLGIRVYVGIELALFVVLLGVVLWFAPEAPGAALLVTAVLAIAEMVTWGALLEGKSWGAPLGVARLALGAIAIAWFTRDMDHATAIAAGVTTVSLGLAAWLMRHRPKPADDARASELVAT